MNITEAEFDALEYVAEMGRVGMNDGPHISSLLERLRPFAKRETDSPQPVAWAVLGDGFEYVSMTPETCVAWAGENGGRTVPLYAAPPTHATPGEGASHGEGTFTDDEIDAIEHGLELLELHSDSDSEQSAKTLISLPKRLT